MDFTLKLAEVIISIIIMLCCVHESIVYGILAVFCSLPGPQER